MSKMETIEVEMAEKKEKKILSGGFGQIGSPRERKQYSSYA